MVHVPYSTVMQLECAVVTMPNTLYNDTVSVVYDMYNMYSICIIILCGICMVGSMISLHVYTVPNYSVNTV